VGIIYGMPIAATSSRRGFLRGIGASATAIGCSTLWVPAHVGAKDLALSDRIDLLYSNQFHFNRRGEPQITIGLMQGQTQVLISAPSGLRVLPSGDGGTAIDGGGRHAVRLLRSQPSQQRFAIVLEELTGPAMRSIDRVVERWRGRGLEPHDHEVGTVFGVDGHVLDNRKVLLTSESFTSESEAAARAKELAKRHGAIGKLYPIVSRRSEGAMVARDLDRDVTIRAEGVLWFAPIGREPITVHDVLSGTTMGSGTRSDRQYWGSIYVAIDRAGKLTVVNLVSESELLAGLVPAEIYASAPAAALKAQAVAARGQLVSKVGTRHPGDPFLLCAEQHCQVYAGKMREHPRTTAAVRDTAGWVAMRPDATRLVDTVYSANSGGHTEHNEHVWPSPADPQLRGRPDPLLPPQFARGIDEDNLQAWLTSPPRSFSRPGAQGAADVYRWRATVDPSAIAGHHGVPASIGKVQRIEVLARGRSGRATTVRLVGDGGRADLTGELRIRRALGGLRTSMFAVLPERDRHGRFELLGGGHGHGVGLCQHGAMGMARDGKSHTEILSHYYQGSKTIKLW
jgi:stage II sporulation protein D